MLQNFPYVHDKRRLFTVAAIVVLALLRVAHFRVLWADEDYHMAAALDLLHGLAPYRDFWYDKPPGNAFYYLLIGALPGWPLRLLDAAYVLVAAWVIYRLARTLWSEREGLVAAFFFSFFMAFYLPSAVLPFAADALMILPHAAAIWLAVSSRPFWAGVVAGCGLLFNPKAVLVIASCLLWGSPLLVLLGAAIVPVFSTATLYVFGALPGYIEQVWRWGLDYARSTPVAAPIRNAAVRIMDWAGFHCALVLGAINARTNWRLLAWLALSLAGVAAGMRFEPRYFLQILPPMCVLASRWRWPRIAFVLLLIPLIRFGPRYIDIALHPNTQWSDVRIDRDSRQVAAQLPRPGTLFVWGYRPGIYVYSRLLPASQFWDSQPLTGVPADRHLHSSQMAISAGQARRNRIELTHSNPEWIVDSLSLYNPDLAPHRYPELREWLKNYSEVDRTGGSIIYRASNQPH